MWGIRTRIDCVGLCKQLPTLSSAPSDEPACGQGPTSSFLPPRCPTRRLVWLILLPFTLWAAYSWFSVLLSGIFAFLMFGIDEIGVQIEEPFG